MDIIQKFNEELKYFDRIEIKIREEKINILNYDKINIYNIYHNLIDSDVYREAFIYPTGRITEILNIISATLTAYECDLADSKSKLLKFLNEGDKVKINGALGEYLGKEEIYSSKKLHIRFKDIDYYFPEEKSYKIHKYEGSASELNNFKSDSQSTILNTDDNFLQYVFNIDIDENNIIPHTKILIVDEKKFVTKLFKEVKLNDIEFSRIFPTAYFSSEENNNRIGTDPFQRNPTVCFVSDISIARKMIENSKDIRLLIINSNTIRNLASTQVEQIIKYNRNLNIHIMSNDFDMNLLSTLSHIGMDIYKWSRDLVGVNRDFEDIKLYNDFYNRNKFQKNQVFLNNFVNHFIEIEEIKINEQFNRIREEILERLDYINDEFSNSETKKSFLGISYYLILKMVNMPIPVKYYLEHDKSDVYYYINKIENLISELYLFANDYTQKNLETLRSIPRDIKQLIDHLNSENPKFYKFKSILEKGNKNSAIIVRKNIDRVIIKSFLIDNNNNYYDVITPIELKGEKVFNELIITGWFKKIKNEVLKNEKSRKINFIFYDYEIDFLKNHFISRDKDYDRVPDVEQKFIREQKQEKISIDFVEKNIQKKHDISEILDEINSEYSEIHINEKNSNRSCMKDAYFVEFDENYYGFFTTNYMANVLSRTEENIKRKPIKKLDVGDEIVFSINDTEDIFHTIVNEIESKNDNLKKAKNLTKLWRTALRKHINTTKQLKNFVNELDELGVSRSENTIRKWIGKDDQIAPNDYEIIDIIANITNNQKLKNNLEKVKKSCQIIRKLHLQLGQYLARKIISSIVNDNEFETKTYNFKGIDPSEYAIILTVNYLEFEKRKVSKEKTNVPIEKF